jgi:hypothetical protein
VLQVRGLRISDRARVAGIRGVETEVKLGARNADMDQPRGEAALRLMRCADRIGYLVATRTHELQYTRQVEAAAVFGHFIGRADVCTTKLMQRVSIPGVFERAA